MNKKKAKVLVVGTSNFYIGDAASGKSTLVQLYAKKGYQFSSDYQMVKFEINTDCRSRSLFQGYP